MENQHMQALRRANEIRLARARLKREVKAGQTPAALIVTAVPPEIEGMEIGDLLMAQRRWGRTRTVKFLAGVPVSENRPIGALTPRQRRAIAERLPA